MHNHYNLWVLKQLTPTTWPSSSGIGKIQGVPIWLSSVENLPS
ncbi:hypothetical protein F383_39203 [Gossypium arboreum]|uniref:Uncharacterized protein n=1 Tax=Gossypium arboreum TaxID=29729 RepID=A0A0B0MK74_GOSAR|nr:hypothetical protein F383_39203 [Gossypium arboreum]